MKDNELIAAVDEFVTDFTRLLEVDAVVTCNLSTVEDSDQRLIAIEYDGEELGYMIGNHGSHLKGLQHVLSLMINKKFTSEDEEKIYVTVDVSGYNKVRNEKIERIALKLADDARALGQPVDMEPLSPNERRVVHMVLSKFDDIKTESYGEGRDRFVRIIPDSDVDLGMLEDEIVDELIGGEEENESEE